MRIKSAVVGKKSREKNRRSRKGRHDVFRQKGGWFGEVREAAA